MAWGSKTQIASALSVNNTTDADTQYPSFASSAVTLNPGESAVVQVVAAFPGTTTNDLGVRVVTTQDDTSETWDDLPWTSFSIGRAASTTLEKSFVVSGCKKFRVEFRKLGTASETITVNAYATKDGISI